MQACLCNLGSAIRNNLSGNNANGAGVLVTGANSNFTMNGGEISGNFARTLGSGTNGGGGVRVHQGTFTMNAGTIQNNESNRHGGGVYLTGSSQFIMNGGVITGNQSSLGAGVGVFATGAATEFPTFTMIDGEIHNNLARPTPGNSAALGGGVNIERGIFNMQGGKIHSNTVQGGSAAQGGGGVFIQANGTFNLINGTIYNNEAPHTGGVRMHDGIFIMTDGLIQNNRSLVGVGGGVNLRVGTSFTMNGGTIDNNTAATNGGGVFVEGGAPFIMNNGTISNNTANGTAATMGGGGIFVAATSSINIQNGSIINNTAVSRGGGIFTGANTGVNAYLNITTSNAVVFSGNSATTGAFHPPAFAVGLANIGFASSSVSILSAYVHPINNYDINFVGTPIL
ncbi:MAG: hypothetical protein FWC68_02980 [Oscillospiraceae bacterium]|nr:hypothetical protein [Oscillospiraceae bacterium]